MKKILKISLILVLLSFSGCVYQQKPEVIFVQVPKYPFKTIESPKDRKFPIRNDYVVPYKAWKAEMYGVINNLNQQIETYLKLNKDKE